MAGGLGGETVDGGGKDWKPSGACDERGAPRLVLPGVSGRFGIDDGGGAIVSGADGRFNPVSCSESTSMFCTGEGANLGAEGGTGDACGGIEDDRDGCSDSFSND